MMKPAISEDDRQELACTRSRLEHLLLSQFHWSRSDGLAYRALCDRENTLLGVAGFGSVALGWRHEELSH